MDGSLVDELKKLENTENDAEIVPRLRALIGDVARTGETSVSWPLLKPLVTRSLAAACAEFYASCPYETDPPDSPDSFEAVRSRIFDALERFESAPFTLQRLCELIVEPKRHYSRCDKFLRGVEKNVLVVTTDDSFCNGFCDDDGLANPAKVRRQSSDFNSSSDCPSPIPPLPRSPIPPETFLALPLRAVVPPSSSSSSSSTSLNRESKVHSTSDHEILFEDVGNDPNLVANESLSLSLADDDATVSSTTVDQGDEEQKRRKSNQEETASLEETWKCRELSLENGVKTHKPLETN